MRLTPNPYSESLTAEIALRQRNMARYVQYKNFDRRRIPFFTFSQAEVIRAFKLQKKQALEQFKAGRTRVELDIEPMQEAIEGIWARVGNSFAKEQFLSLKGFKTDMELKQDVPDFTVQILGYLEYNGGQKITGINQETMRRINLIIEQATEEGLGIPEASKLISKNIDLMAKTRAVRIARTEIVGASNQGAIIGARNTNIPLLKEWVATMDARTRDDHTWVDGDRVEQEGKFSVGGVLMNAPGDPTAPVEQVVNCRCAVAFVPVRTFLFEN